MEVGIDMILANKKWFRSLSCTLALAMSFSIASPALTADVADLKPMTKATYPADDSHKTWVPPNVFFLLDISGPMTFTPNGRMPIYDDGDSPQTHAGWYEECTFGSGFRPLTVNGVEARGTGAGEANRSIYTTTTRKTEGRPARPTADGQRVAGTRGWGRYGRDLDESNNIIGDSNCYYTSDNSKPYLLTFRSRTLADWDGTRTLTSSEKAAILTETRLAGGYIDYTQRSVTPPNLGATTDLISNTTANNVPSSYLDELLTYMPNRNNRGKPVPKHLWCFLVPNDSRIYKMKLVLWRLLEDNDRLLAKMKLGMGSTMFITRYHNPTTAISVLHKSYPYDAATYYAPAYGNVQFWNGVGPWYTDNVLKYVYESGGTTAQTISNSSAWAPTGIDVTHYQQPITSSRWITVNRARMLVPFDYMYNAEDDGSYTRTSNLARFRQYIDGIEDLKTSSVSNVAANIAANNPEFMPSGKVPLSTSIYGHRIPKTSGSDASMLTRNDRSGGNALRYAAQLSGISDAFKSAENNTIHSINYPPNTTANDSSPSATTDSTTHVLMNNYLIDEANPDDTSTTQIVGGTAVGSVIDFFSPPKTGNSVLPFDPVNTAGYFPVVGSCQRNWLVVFTAGNDSDGLTGEEAVRELYENTRTMRGRRWDKDTKQWVEASYAMESGVRTLVVGFVDQYATDTQSENLKKSLRKMAEAGDPGNPDAAPFFANDVPQLIAALKAVLMRVNADQYAASSSTAAADPAGEVGARVLYSPAYIATEYGQYEGYFEKLRIKNDKNERQWEVNEELQKRNLSDRDLYTYTGGSVVDLDTVGNSTFASLAGVPESTVMAFRKWLREFDGKTLLGDMEHAGYKIVGDAGKDTGIGARDTAIYLQTNRGFLHAIDDKNGREKWAFVPPNALSRIRGMKYTEEGAWIEKGAYGRLDSLPMNLLDGPMITKDVQLSSSSNYKTILIGNLGWGGNGFYAMDITNPGTTPQFLWAIDNGALTDWTTPAPPFGWGAASNMGTTYDEYKELGLTIAPPLLMRYKPSSSETDIGILPAGLCSDYYNYKNTGLNTHQGQKLLIFNPANAAIIASLPSYNGGMMIAPITSVTDGNGIALAFYTADSHGNIYRCEVNESVPADRWSLERIFEVRNMTSGSTNEPLMIPRALMIADNDETNARWIFAATGNLMIPNELGEMIENPAHYVLGFNQSVVLDKHNGFADLSTPGMEELTYEVDSIDPGHGIASKDITPVDDTDPDYLGWYLPLRPAAGDLLAEYVTTSPFLYGGVLYFSTFTPRATTGDTAEICPLLGDAKLYAVDPSTGTGAWNGSRALVVRDAKIVGMTASDGKLYLGIRRFNDNQSEAEAAGFKEITPSVWEKEGAGRGDGAPSFQKDKPFVHYWKENFGGQ